MHLPSRLIFAVLCCLLLAAGVPRGAFALEHLVIDERGAQRQLAGRLLVTAQDGGLLLLAPDGVLWPVQPKQIVERTSDDEVFRPLAADALGKQVLAELPAGFEIHRTAHYLICHNTSKAYASWCGALLERLNRAFVNYWKRKGLELHEPEMPLVAVIFADRTAYLAYSEKELGAAATEIVGYYSLRSNHVTMYDLTGSTALRCPGDRRSSAASINQMLARPEAEPMVATVIHEATHQVAFNCGMHRRYADIPLWTSEGIAVFSETPDLENSKGWRSIGAVNRSRLARFRQYLPGRPRDSLLTLIRDDKRMRDGRQALDAYAEAWALNYYLIRQKPKQFVEYLKVLADKKELVWDEPERRVAQFRAAFGQDLDQLDADFLKQLQKVR